MNQILQRSSWRRRGISWAPVLFLLVFLGVLSAAAMFIVVPMLHKAADASPEDRRRISAYAALFACVLLLFLLVGLLFTMRIGRASRLRNTTGQHRATEYPDAWQEAARRLKTPDPEDLEENRDEEKGPEKQG